MWLRYYARWILPKLVALELFGEERLTMFNSLTIEMPVKVSFTAKSREWKTGICYTTLRCFNIVPMVAVSVPTPPLTTNPAYVLNPIGNITKQQTQYSTGVPYEKEMPFDDDLLMFLPAQIACARRLYFCKRKRDKRRYRKKFVPL